MYVLLYKHYKQFNKTVIGAAGQYAPLFLSLFIIWKDAAAQCTPPVMDAPANVTVCGGLPVDVIFTGTPGATFNWTNSNPLIGLPASGSGDISFTAANVATAQTATITITPSLDGCTGLSQTFMITVNRVPNISESGLLVLCSGVYVVISLDGEPGYSYSYEWTNSNTAIGLPASGTGFPAFTTAYVPGPETAVITYTATSAEGCTSQPAYSNIMVIPNATVDPPDDITLCPGEAVNIPFTGTPASAFQWVNSNTAIGLGAFGAGQQIIFTAANVSSTQVAVVTVSPYLSNNTCFGPPVTFTITVTPIPTVAPPPNQTVCAGALVNVNFSGTGNPVFNWTNSNPDIGLPASGSGNISFSAANVASPQTASITVTPVAGDCIGTPRTFTITVNPTPGVNPPADIAVCAALSVNVSFSGTAGAVFNWTNSDPSIGLPASGSGNINFTAANVASQTVATVTVTPKLGNCFGSPVTFTITVNPLEAAINPGNQDYCGGESVSINFSGIPGAMFNWTNSNLAIGLPSSGGGNLNFTTANVTSVQTGTVTVTSAGANCPGPPAAFSITVSPVPTVSQPANFSICSGQSVVLNFSGTPGAMFNWTNSNPVIGLPASGGGNISFTGAEVNAQETATVTVTPEINGCMGLSRTFTITVKPVPTVDPPADITVCGGTTLAINFTGSPGATFNWTCGNGNIGLPPTGTGDIGNTTANPYPFSLVSLMTVTPVLGGCTGPTDSFTIKVISVPPGGDSLDCAITYCENLSTSIDFLFFPGEDYVYEWTNNNTATGVPPSGTGDIFFTSANVESVETSWITVITSNFGCVGPPTWLYLQVAPVIEIPLTNKTVCSGEPVAINFTNGDPPFTWTNSNPAIGLPASGTGNIYFNAANLTTAQTATITVNSTFLGQCIPGIPGTGYPGCVNPPISFTITVIPGPTVLQPTDKSFCAGQNANISFSGTPGATLSWTNSNPAIGLPASGTGNLNFTAANVASQELATITLTASIGDCIGQSVEFDIAINPIPFINPPENQTVCSGQPLSVPFDGSPDAAFEWLNSNPSIGLDASGSGDISFTAATLNFQQIALLSVTPLANTCAGPSQTFTITLLPAPNVATPADRTACSGELVNISFGAPGATLNWSNDNPDIGLPESGSGNISFTAANVTSIQTANITMTPQNGDCPGPPVNFSITVQPVPAMTPPNNVTACGGDEVAVSFNGTPGLGFNWTNSNPAVGLPAAGSGNLNFTTAGVVSTQTGVVTVTPVSAGGCSGAGQTFTITVNPTPAVNPVSDLSACGGQALSVLFSAAGNSVFSWVNSNPAIGLGASGSGNISFTAANVTAAQSGTVVVTPSLTGNCPGMADTFLINIVTVPSVGNPGNRVACAGDSVNIVFTGDAGATFSWTNSNPAIGLPVSGTGDLTFTAANTGAAATATLVVTPQLGACNGLPVSFSVTVQSAVTAQISGNAAICAGENATLSAGGGSSYLWSSGENTATIVVNPTLTTTYIVDVSGPGGCADTASAIIQVNHPDAVTLQQSSCNPADTGTAVLMLTNRFGCDSIVTISTALLPSDATQLSAFTCNPAQAGIFTQTLTNRYGCDSIVATTVVFDPAAADTTMLAQVTCDPAQTDTTQVLLTGTDGCDSLVITTTSLLPEDIINLFSITCDPNAGGIFTQNLTNQYGCDSTVITTVVVSPSDTTYWTNYDCDPDGTGVFTQNLNNQYGCDSLVVTTVLLAPSQVTNLTTFTCNPNNAGVFTKIWTNQYGCDSTVITTVVFNPAAVDTVWLAQTTCDPAQAGLTQQLLTGPDGCDSLVITTTSLLPEDIINLFSTTCDPSGAGTFTQNLTNHYGCDSTVVSTVSLLPSDMIYLSGFTCDPSGVGTFTQNLTNHYGCDSTVVTIVSLLPGNVINLTDFTCNPNQTGVFTQNLTNQYGCDSTVVTTVLFDPAAADTTWLTAATCDPSGVGMSQILTVGADGCDSLLITVTALAASPVAQATAALIYHSHAISCHGASDGSAAAVVSGGNPPYQFAWSEGSAAAIATGLAAGDYAVTVSDQNACTTVAYVSLNEPPPLDLSFFAEQPGCGDSLAGATVFTAGGVGPYAFSVDNKPAAGIEFFIGAGTHLVQATDANGCTADTTVSLHIAPLPHIALPADTAVQLGELLTIEATTNLSGWKNLEWQPLPDSACAMCLIQTWMPLETQLYTVRITDSSGCTAQASVRVIVKRAEEIYVPNVFSPDGDGRNDSFVLNGGPSVAYLEKAALFDRWGDLVYSWDAPVPLQEWPGWDGSVRGKKAEVGVYVYYLKIRLISGEVVLKEGDVTIVKR